MDIMSTREILKEWIKLIYTYPDYSKQINNIEKCKRDKIVLIGTPAHGNLGDQAIAVCEMKYLDDLKGDYTVFEISMPLYKTHRKKLKSLLQKKDIIVISGGGWMGNLWIHNEITIREIVSDYPENKVVIFPQTLHYTDDLQGKRVLDKTKLVFKTHKELYLSVRDEKSYTCAIDNLGFSTDKLLFCPDMALYGTLKNDNTYQNESKIALLCLRNDIEKLSDSLYIANCIKERGYTVKNTTTVKKYLIKRKNRNKILKELIQSYSGAAFMVTDRLHAMIFALLAGIPCYVLNNSTGKVFGVASYLEKAGMPVRMITDKQDVISEEFKLVGKTYILEAPLRKYFKDLAILFNSELKGDTL